MVNVQLVTVRSTSIVDGTTIICLLPLVNVRLLIFTVRSTYDVKYPVSACSIDYGSCSGFDP